VAFKTRVAWPSVWSAMAEKVIAWRKRSAMAFGEQAAAEGFRAR
jgi:hypothetical protein